MKTEFKTYMKIQIRYIRLVARARKLEPLAVVDRYALRFRDLYAAKHNANFNIK